ncbi:hypothetical protein [Clostridium aquiflavi]|uniref:Uncharacterized protein n=1 Tax=Clostridium aquiflavi TaxID=3073603 RepID=A0ABU1EKQ7_9CLOT|nr:hypothetical protein [Clostridium sp. 5N-1]MDR5588963.1 hypothetical protein [Clostridium sp. 5N-1]
MRYKSKKASNETSGEILEKWIKIIIFTYLSIWGIMNLFSRVLIKTNMYGEFYRDFIFYLISMPGILFFLLGLIINELIYFFKCKSYKKVASLIIIALCICGISYKLIKYSGSYRCYKDLDYVINDTYCEDVQELNNIYEKVITGKYSSTTIYIETIDFKFQAERNIVEKREFNKFKAKFDNVKKVRIKYLPNTNILLSIEPVKDEG